MTKPQRVMKATRNRKTKQKGQTGPLSKQFYRGAVTAIIAHVNAWLLLSSIDKLVYLAGHTTALLGIQAMELLQR